MNLEARKIAISTPCNLLWNHDNSLSPALINGPYFIFQLASNLNKVDKAEKPQRMRYEKLDRYKFKMADDKLYFAT